MNLKISEVKTPQSFKTFLVEVCHSSIKRSYADMLVEILDDVIFISPETKETDCEANDYGRYRHYKLQINEKLNAQTIEPICKELGVKFDNYDLV